MLFTSCLSNFPYIFPLILLVQQFLLIISIYFLMDQRIAYVTHLKDTLSQRASFQIVDCPSELQSNSTEDVEFQLAQKQITSSSFFIHASKHIKIRLLNWLDRLSKVGLNKIWVANRDNYIKLLNLMCHCEYLTYPFLQMPPDCDLPNLRKHQITRIVDEVERQIKTSRLTSRKVSVNVEAALGKVGKTHANESKKGNYDSLRFGDEETLQMKNWNIFPTLETDFDEKTISFNFSSSDKNWFSKQSDDFRDFSGNFRTIDKNQSKEVKDSADKSKLREITNYQTRPVSNKKEEFEKCARPPLQKRMNSQESPQKLRPIQEKENQPKAKEYWQSNEVTGNNSNAGTPKYLDKYPLNQQPVEDSVVIVSFREGETQSCDCTPRILGDGWLSQIFKKLTL